MTNWRWNTRLLSQETDADLTGIRCWFTGKRETDRLRTRSGLGTAADHRPLTAGRLIAVTWPSRMAWQLDTHIYPVDVAVTRPVHQPVPSWRHTPGSRSKLAATFTVTWRSTFPRRNTGKWGQTPCQQRGGNVANFLADLTPLWVPLHFNHRAAANRS